MLFIYHGAERLLFSHPEILIAIKYSWYYFS